MWWAAAHKSNFGALLPESCDLHAIDATHDRRRQSPTHWLICAQVGRGEVVPALEEGVLGVREGGVRQIIFPPELGYPMVGDQRDGE